MSAKQLTAKMIDALFAAADGHNTRNMHGTYKALETRGFVEYVWGRAECWVITPAGATLASSLRASTDARLAGAE